MENQKVILSQLGVFVKGIHFPSTFFLLCSEGFNGLNQHAMDEGQVEGFSLCRNGPKLSHLFFADDKLFFYRARIDDLKTIQEILHKYEKALGQKINSKKTNLFFSKVVSKTSKDQIKKSAWGTRDQGI